jgi:hypothetical protein
MRFLEVFGLLALLPVAAHSTTVDYVPSDSRAFSQFGAPFVATFAPDGGPASSVRQIAIAVENGIPAPTADTFSVTLGTSSGDELNDGDTFLEFFHALANGDFTELFSSF